eukprot:TRINITY_DN4050_c0_g1_i1.p1 TRINITY_DN4050_c0_g1~~TRINITY_DN4050_c0_g1_i1.p1  ORF type:complete len:400 (+),score=111.68 TRINITY_DN4050_c0_g1_i1:293-1492(+)
MINHLHGASSGLIDDFPALSLDGLRPAMPVTDLIPTEPFITIPPMGCPRNQLLRHGSLSLGDSAVDSTGYHSPMQQHFQQFSGNAFPTPLTPLSLNDLVEVEVLGRGASAVVKLVQHRVTGEKFALKIIKVEGDEKSLQFVTTELRINLEKLRMCDCVVQCLESFYLDGSIYMVLEYMDRGSLADMILINKGAGLEEKYVAAIARRVLQGLQVLHREHHILHRDIKPSNILLSHTGEIKISDFGVSATLSHTRSEKQTFVGTYTYMSPERIQAHPYNHTSDIWSLGLSLLEMGTGEYPYQPPNPEEGWTNLIDLLSVVVFSPAPTVPPSSGFSPEFHSFISACLEKNPEDRSTAEQLLEHPLLLKYECSHIDLAELFHSPSTKRRPGRTSKRARKDSEP